MKSGEKVVVYIAVVKRIKRRLYLHPLKGVLVDKENPKIPLENPYKMVLEWKKRNVASPKDYTLKIPLIQVSGDVNRQCKTEFKEGFKFADRQVDETSKSLGDHEDDTSGDANDDDEYQLAVVLAEGDEQLQADWSTLIVSANMCNST